MYCRLMALLKTMFYQKNHFLTIYFYKPKFDFHYRNLKQPHQFYLVDNNSQNRHLCTKLDLCIYPNRQLFQLVTKLLFRQGCKRQIE